jgi:hypothetical protein
MKSFAIRGKGDLLQPRNDVREVKDSSCPVRIASANWMREWLKGKRTAIKGRDSSWIGSLWFANATRIRKGLN